MLTVNSTINLAGQAVPNIIPAVQGDTGRSIEFTLADFTIPAGSTATYYVQKPSGEAVYNSATIDGNKVTVELTAQSLAETGDNYGQVRILNGEDVVTSFDFILLVKPFRGIGAIESSTEMNIFDEAVQNAMANINGMLPNIIAPVFDTSTAYVAGDYVIYSGKLYQFTSGHAAGAWTGVDAEECTVAEDISQLKEDLENIKGKGGLTEDAKQALLTCFRHIAFLDDESDYYGALESALYPPADLVSISCVYTQTVTVYTDTALDDLRSDLVVTAHFDDSSTRTVSQYALSGTLEVGTSTITVSYGGKTTAFDVIVSKGIDYTEDALADVTWNTGYGYEKGSLIQRSGAYATDKFNVQDLSYSVVNLDTTNNTNYFINVWDENDNYLGVKNYSDARFQWKPEYKIAIEVRNAGAFDPTTMTMLPYDKRATAVNEFEIDLASMASSVVKANGYYELNVNAVMASAGVNSSNYNDTINRQSIIGMINQSVYPNNFPFSTPIRIGTFNYGANMLLSINVDGIAVSDANLPTLKAYLVDNNVKIKYNY